MREKASGAGTKDWEKASQSLHITSVVPSMTNITVRYDPNSFARGDFKRALEAASRRVSESEPESKDSEASE